MSEPAGQRPVWLAEPVVCDYCGCEIVETDQPCVALDDGVCSP